MMKVGTIQLGGHTIEVVLVDVLFDEEQKIELGCYKECENTIYISKTAGTRKSQALLHEIVHAIDDIFNNGHMDEDTVDAIAQGFYQLLKGGDVFKALMNEDCPEAEAAKGGD